MWLHCLGLSLPRLPLPRLFPCAKEFRRSIYTSSWKSRPVIMKIATCHDKNFDLPSWKLRPVMMKTSICHLENLALKIMTYHHENVLNKILTGHHGNLHHSQYNLNLSLYVINLNQISILTFHNKTSLNLSRYISNTHNKILTYHNVSRPFVIKSRNGVPQKLRLKYFCKQSIKSVIKNQNMWNTFLEMPLLTDSLLPRQQFVFWYPTLTRVFVKAVIT